MIANIYIYTYTQYILAKHKYPCVSSVNIHSIFKHVCTWTHANGLFGFEAFHHSGPGEPWRHCMIRDSPAMEHPCMKCYLEEFWGGTKTEQKKPVASWWFKPCGWKNIFKLDHFPWRIRVKIHAGQRFPWFHYGTQKRRPPHMYSLSNPTSYI